jgi:hypothetical protein
MNFATQQQYRLEIVALSLVFLTICHANPFTCWRRYIQYLACVVLGRYLYRFFQLFWGFRVFQFHQPNPSGDFIHSTPSLCNSDSTAGFLNYCFDHSIFLNIQFPEWLKVSMMSHCWLVSDNSNMVCTFL